MKHDAMQCHWVGLDVSKKVFDAGLARSDQHFPSTSLGELPWRQFPRTPVGVKQFIAWLDSLAVASNHSDVRVVMEATGNYSVELAAWLTLQRACLAPAIEAPTRTAAYIKSLGLRNKTDGLEARALAFYGVERRPVAYEPLTPERQELREVTRCRDFLVRQQTALKNRQKEHSSADSVCRVEAKHLRQLAKDIEAFKKTMIRIIQQCPALKKDYDLLNSIDGVGPITAATVLAELGDLRRFTRARQLTAYVGVCPSIRESGSSVKGKTHMSKHGNARVRRVLYLSAMATLRKKGDTPIKDMQRRMCQNGMVPKAALGAAMRKQLCLMRAVVINETPFDPQWKTHAKKARSNAK